jgi:tRNA threonylcarbamoyl adenosine modification protein YeaZ
VIVGTGPGGFTGLRIGLATALALGQALGVEVTGASSLEALALGASDGMGAGCLVAPVIDARRGQVFAAAYRRGEGDALAPVLPPAPRAPADLAVALAGLGEEVLVAGDGVPLLTRPYPETLRAPPAASAGHAVSAACLARRVAAGAGGPAVPQYGRLPDAEERRRAAEAVPG